jgi:hypothetical protein
MTLNFLKYIKSFTNTTSTLNGAKSNLSSGNSVLDFFALAAATRDNVNLALDLFKKSLAADKNKTIKILFYLRDVRGGQGERKIFRECILLLQKFYIEEFYKIFKEIPNYGRWDDLVFIYTKTSDPKILEFIKSQMDNDLLSGTPSLLGKWLPSENTSSKETVVNAKKIITALKVSPKEYRINLSKLRKKIKILEHNLSTKNYPLEYSKLPSQAMLRHIKAFKRNDEVNFEKYLEEVKNNKQKINTKTIYPYQVYNLVHKEYTNALDTIWNNLPNYAQDINAIVVADVSGSMQGRPMSVAVSLALYFAEKSKGVFRNHFITFSEKPNLQEIKGDNLQEKMWSIEKAQWGYNTNLQAVFDLILNAAVKNKLADTEIPKKIYIISDMEFDQACPKNHTNFKEIEHKYKRADYKMPTLIFWNVNTVSKQVPVLESDKNVVMVSGLSPVTFSFAVENKNPVEFMEEIINGPRYCNLI